MSYALLFDSHAKPQDIKTAHGIRYTEALPSDFDDGGALANTIAGRVAKGALFLGYVRNLDEPIVAETPPADTREERIILPYARPEAA